MKQTNPPGGHGAVVRGTVIDRQDRRRIEGRLSDSFTLPVRDASIDFAFIRIFGEAVETLSDTAAVLREVGRIVTSEAEIFVLVHDARDSITDARLPRWRALLRQVRVVTRALTVPRYRALQAMLRAAGMTDFEWHAPEYDSDGAPIRMFPVTPGVGWLLGPTWRQRLRARALPTVAVRSAKRLLPSSGIGSVINKAATLGQQDYPQKATTILISRKEKIVGLLGAPGSGYVVRIPFSRWALNSCRQNMRALRHLQSLPGIKLLTPRPLYESDDGERYCSIESLVEGIPLKRLRQTSESIFLVEDLLRMMNPSGRHETETLEGSAFQDWVAKPLETLLAAAPDETSSAVVRDFLHESLFGMQLPLGLTHGDLSPNNLYIKNGRLAGVIDWDEGSMRGIPMLDAISHLISRQYRRKQGFSAALWNLANTRWPVQEELDFLERFYHYFEVDAKQHFKFVMLQWLHAVSQQFDLQDAKEKRFIESRIIEIVRLLVAHAKRGAVAIRKPVDP